MVTLGRPVLSSCEIHGIFADEDWPPDADGPDIAQKQLSGVDVAGKTFKVHLDGYDQRDLLAGGPTKRPSFDAKFSRAGNRTELLPPDLGSILRRSPNGEAEPRRRKRARVLSGRSQPC